MAEKLPVILDNRNNNTVLDALQKLLPSLQKSISLQAYLKSVPCFSLKAYGSRCLKFVF